MARLPESHVSLNLDTIKGIHMAVEVKVLGLALDKENKVPILVLQQRTSNEILPIQIGAVEAMAISMALQDLAPPRPLTHDIMLQAMKTLGANVTCVHITDLQQGTYFAELELEQNQTIHRLDCRPSDAIALALRAGAPIYVNLNIFALGSSAHDQSNLEPHHSAQHSATAPVILSEEHDASDPDDRLQELLRKLKPATKYKM